MAAGAAGVAVATADVVMPEGVEARLVWAKAKGPPLPPAVVF